MFYFRLISLAVLISVPFSFSMDHLLRFAGPPSRSYAKYNVKLPELREFTLCYWLKLHKKNSGKTHVFSYATTKEPDSILSWQNHTEKGPSTIGMNIGGNAVLITLKLDIATIFDSGEWQHICYGWSSYAMDGYIAIGGCKQKGVKINILKPDEPVLVKEGGVVILGQDQDVYGGDFDPKDALSGDISQLQLWDELLHPSKLMILHECGRNTGTVLSWGFYQPLELHNVIIKKSEVCNLGISDYKRKCYNF